MRRPSARSLALGALCGVAILAIVLGLYARYGYPLPDADPAGALFVTAMLAAGGAPVLAAAHTPLATPAVGWLALLGWTVAREVTTPAPEWSELGSHVVVHGQLFVLHYATAWPVWLSALCWLGAVEFALRRWYELGEGRLRALGPLPRSWRATWGAALGMGAVFGAALGADTLTQGVSPERAAPLIVGLVVVGGTAAAAVPLGLALSRWLVSPAALAALLAGQSVHVTVFSIPDGPVHLLLFGPFAVVAALAGWLERELRRRHGRRAGGDDGGDGTDRADEAAR